MVFIILVLIHGVSSSLSPVVVYNFSPCQVSSFIWITVWWNFLWNGNKIHNLHAEALL